MDFFFFFLQFLKLLKKKNPNQLLDNDWNTLEFQKA